MTVKVNVSDRAYVTIRYVQDAWVPSKDFSHESPFSATWLYENNDLYEYPAFSSPCDEIHDYSETVIDCHGFNTHFMRHFYTGESDRDYQWSTDIAGE